MGRHVLGRPVLGNNSIPRTGSFRRRRAWPRRRRCENENAISEPQVEIFCRRTATLQVRAQLQIHSKLRRQTQAVSANLRIISQPGMELQSARQTRQTRAHDRIVREARSTNVVYRLDTESAWEFRSQYVAIP